MKNVILLFIIFISCFFTFTVVSYADDINTNIPVTPLSPEEHKNLKVTVLTSEPQKKAIECFDVNEDGFVAVGYRKFMEYCNISVYGIDGQFKYGFSFKTAGNFDVYWDADNIVIYYVRGNLAVSYNANGQIQWAGIADKDDEKYNDWLDFFDSNEKENAFGKYVLKNNGKTFYLLSSYSQIVFLTDDGTEKIIYDASTLELIKSVIIVLIISFFGFIVVWRAKRDRGRFCVSEIKTK